MEPEPRSNQRLRAYFRPVRIPNFLDRVDHVLRRHSAAWLGFVCRHSRQSELKIGNAEFSAAFVCKPVGIPVRLPRLLHNHLPNAGHFEQLIPNRRRVAA